MKNLLLIPILFLSLNVFSQDQEYICADANPQLLNLIKKGSFVDIVIDGYGGEGSLTTSYLKNDESKCTYSPKNLSDNNTSTAWVEGDKGYGIGEFVIVPKLDLIKPVQIWNGYGKSKKLYYANSRASKIKIYIIKAKISSPSQNGAVYKDLEIVTSKTITLKDINDYQNLPIPKFNLEKYYSKVFEQETNFKYFLGIEIIDVYRGNKWSDTCISELRNY